MQVDEFSKVSDDLENIEVKLATKDKALILLATYTTKVFEKIQRHDPI